MSTFIVHVTGNPNITTLGSINVRAQPSTATGTAILFQAPIGTNNLPVLAVQPDLNNTALNGKVYQWFQVRFANGSTGWVRDDLVSLNGDGTAFGYPNLTKDTYAFGLTRQLLPTNPTPVPVPTPPTPTPTPPTPTPVPTPTTDVIGTVISDNGLNLRASPVTGAIVARLPFLEQVKILTAQLQAATSFHWAQVQTPQGTGWVRTDFLSISGDGTRFGLSKGDEYPAPIQAGDYWYVRGQNDVQPDGSVDQHLGWDFSSNPGQPIHCGPQGGLVIKLLSCTKCTPTKPNVLSQNIPLNSPAVLNDPAWGFGYGNAVIVRYTNDLLPASTRTRLTNLGLGGQHLFVIYAHLSAVSVQLQQRLGAFAQVGIIGNTGNSSALHVHVEVHASADANNTNYGGMPEFDPQLLFLR